MNIDSGHETPAAGGFDTYLYQAGCLETAELLAMQVSQGLCVRGLRMRSTQYPDGHQTTVIAQRASQCQLRIEMRPDDNTMLIATERYDMENSDVGAWKRQTLCFRRGMPAYATTEKRGVTHVNGGYHPLLSPDGESLTSGEAESAVLRDMLGNLLEVSTLPLARFTMARHKAAKRVSRLLHLSDN